MHHGGNLIVVGCKVAVESLCPIVNSRASPWWRASGHPLNHVRQDRVCLAIPSVYRHADERFGRNCPFEEYSSFNVLVHANDSVASKCLQDFAGVPLVSRTLDDFQDDRLVTACAKDKE